MSSSSTQHRNITNTMDDLTINELRPRTQIGFSPHELGKRQELVITIHLKKSIKGAGETDLVSDTVNYKSITKDVLNQVENKTYNLIEAVATDVARICVVRYEVPQVKVKVEKPNCLRFAKSSSVLIERRFEDFDWQTVHVSIGSNIKPQENIPRALELLTKKSQIMKVSSAFKTTPLLFKEQADFVNMAAVIRTKLHPEG